MEPPTRFEQALRDWSLVFIHRSMQEYQEWVRDSGLSHSQLAALLRLHHAGACPVSAIGQDLRVTAAAASQIVDRLVQQGLLRREEDDQDRRVRRVALTPRGQEIVRQAIESRVSWMRQLVAALDSDQQQSIIESLDQLTRTAIEIEGSQSAPVP